MNENYKNILEELNEATGSIYKQGLRKEFQDKIRNAKPKIDSLYNMAFYDTDLITFNFNALLLQYKEYRELKKKTFLFTLRIKDYSNFYYLSIDDQVRKTARLQAVVKMLDKTLSNLKLEADIYMFGDTLNLLLNKKEDCMLLFKNKIFEQTRDILGFRKFTEIVPTYSRNKKNILEAYRKNITEISEQEKRLNELKKDN